MSNSSFKIAAGLLAAGVGRLCWDIISSLSLDVGDEPWKAIGVDDWPEIEYVEKQSTLIVGCWGESLPPCKSQKYWVFRSTNYCKCSTKQVPLWVLWVLTWQEPKIGSSGVLTKFLIGYKLLIYLVFLIDNNVLQGKSLQSWKYIIKRISYYLCPTHPSK